MSLFEDHILDELLRHHVLLLHRTVTTLLLTYHHSYCLRLEQNAARGDGVGAAVLGLVDTDAGESHLEDADTLQVDLLTELEVMFHSLTQLLKNGDDVGALHTGLLLDVVSQTFGRDELLIIDCLGKELAVGAVVLVVVLGFNKSLCHNKISFNN